MDLFKIFRMQEPVPKDMLIKSQELAKFREVVQEKDVILRNSKCQLRELEQHVAELEARNRELELKPSSCGTNLIKEYELLYIKMLKESENIVNENRKLKEELNETRNSNYVLTDKLNKVRLVLEEYERRNNELKMEADTGKGIIETLTKELNNYRAVSEEGSSNVKEAGFQDFMFEPLKGLDK